MKKTLVLFLILIVAVLFPLYAVAEENPSFDRTYIFTFPKSLIEIEDEAFWGTSVKTVVFLDGLTRIDENAFDKASHLRDIYIPPSTEYIAENAFPLNKGLTIHSFEGSLAERWAFEHQVFFEVSNIWAFISDGAFHLELKHSSFHEYFQEVPYKYVSSINDKSGFIEKSMRPQDRPELNPIDYKFP